MNNKLLALLSTVSLVGTAGVAGVATVACGSSSSDKCPEYKKISKFAINGDYALLNSSKSGGIEYPQAIIDQFANDLGLVDKGKKLTAGQVTALETVMPILDYSVQFTATSSSPGVNNKSSVKATTNLPGTFTVKLSTLVKMVKHMEDNAKATNKSNYFDNFKSSYNYISSIDFSIPADNDFTIPGTNHNYAGYKITFDKMFATVQVPTKESVDALVTDTNLATKIKAGIDNKKYEPGSTSAVQVTVPTSTVTLGDEIGFTSAGVSTANTDYQQLLLNLYNYYAKASDKSHKEVSIAQFKNLVPKIEVKDVKNAVVTTPAEGDSVSMAVEFNSTDTATATSLADNAVPKADVETFQSFLKEKGGWDINFDTITDSTTYVLSGKKITIAKANNDWNTAKEDSGLLSTLSGSPAFSLESDKTASFKNINGALVKSISEVINLKESKLSSDLNHETTDLLDIFDLKADFVKEDNKPSTPVTSDSSGKTNAYSTTAPKLKVMITNVQDLNALVPETEFGLKLINWLYQKGVTNGEAVTVTDADQTPVNVNFTTPK